MATDTKSNQDSTSADSNSSTADNSPTAAEAALEHFREYAKERPETVALWALGIGFVLGWKLKPW